MLFELLFLIYLLPVVVLFILLLRFARFIIVNVFRAAIWIIKKTVVLLWKGLVLFTIKQIGVVTEKAAPIKK